MTFSERIYKPIKTCPTECDLCSHGWCQICNRIDMVVGANIWLHHPNRLWVPVACLHWFLLNTCFVGTGWTQKLSHVCKELRGYRCFTLSEQKKNQLTLLTLLKHGGLKKKLQQMILKQRKRRDILCLPCLTLLDGRGWQTRDLWERKGVCTGDKLGKLGCGQFARDCLMW